MPTPTLEEVVSSFRSAAALAAQWASGDENSVVSTVNGDYPTLAGLMKNAQDQIDAFIASNPIKLLKAYRGNVGQLSGTTRIPFDNGAPLVSEGTQLMAETITPVQIGNIVSIDFSCQTDGSSNTSVTTLALFRGSTLLAVASTGVTGKNSNVPNSLRVRFNDIATTLESRTYSVRIGNTAGTWYVNRGATATMGGNARTGWSIDEVMPS